MKYDNAQFDWKTFNCGHFVRLVWLDLTAVDLGLRMPAEITRQSLVEAFEKGEREIVGTLIHEIKEPVEPCIVLLSPGRHHVPHCGVLLDGALYHLPKGGKVAHEPLDAVMTRGGFKSARYFR